MVVSERVCVVGAGGSGLVAVHALTQAGLDVVALEAQPDLGGSWRYGGARSACYASLRTNTSRRRTSLRAFPLPRHGDTFPGHAEMLDYLERFAERFELRRHIRFGAEVVAAEPDADGWTIRTGDGRRLHARDLVVAVGVGTPRRPALPGRFAGLELHARDYRTPEPFAGLDVVVVGLGCSAAEIAPEIARTARTVTLSVRSGSTVLPRRLGPLPLDWLDTRSASRLPLHVRERLLWPLVRLAAGDQAAAGLPPAPRPFARKPLTVSDRLIGAVRRGEIAVVGEIAQLAGEHVLLRDGRRLAAQAVIYATGYETSFPFLPPSLEQPAFERAHLYRGIVSLTGPPVFYVGLTVLHGALLPVAEAQAAWVAAVLSGRLPLPAPGAMAASVAADEAERRRLFDARYALLHDRLPYQRALEREARAAR